MQAERDGLTEELKRVNANLDLANLERDRLINKCHADEGTKLYSLKNVCLECLQLAISR